VVPDFSKIWWPQLKTHDANTLSLGKLFTVCQYSAASFRSVVKLHSSFARLCAPVIACDPTQSLFQIKQSEVQLINKSPLMAASALITVKRPFDCRVID
jgi:hypothetical protein